MNIKKIIKEEVENYMFFQNLNTIKKHVDMLLSKSPEEMDKTLKKHDWASEHITTAKTNIEDVCNFFMDNHVRESKDKKITCSGCGWSWRESESSVEDLYNCHECGEDNTPKVDEDKGPCWKNYKQVGMKEKGGKQVPNCVPVNETINEAEYQGREVTLNKPTKGDRKKFKVYVKNDKGNVIKVEFGDPNMEIRRDNPEAKKSFRARHKCSEKKDKTTAGYWSCKMWSNKKVSDIT
jgi:hypothetical protein